MIGEEIGSETGKVTSRRVLEGDDFRYVKMEITFETSCRVLGLEGMNIGTYIVYERVPGQLYGEGRGIFMSADGEAIWNGHGIGRPTGEGMGVRFAASIAFQAGPGPLARLNEILAVVEHETDDAGNAKSTLWEWK